MSGNVCVTEKRGIFQGKTVNHMFFFRVFQSLLLMKHFEVFPLQALLTTTKKHALTCIQSSAVCCFEKQRQSFSVADMPHHSE